VSLRAYTVNQNRGDLPGASITLAANLISLLCSRCVNTNCSLSRNLQCSILIIHQYWVRKGLVRSALSLSLNSSNLCFRIARIYSFDIIPRNSAQPLLALSSDKSAVPHTSIRFCPSWSGGSASITTGSYNSKMTSQWGQSESRGDLTRCISENKTLLKTWRSFCAGWAAETPRFEPSFSLSFCSNLEMSFW